MIVEVRDVTLRRVGTIPPEDLDLTFTERALTPGEWSLRLPTEHPMTAHLRAPGAGLIVTHTDPEVGVLTSGPVRKPDVSADTTDPRGILTVTGTSDSLLLWHRRAYPLPSVADVTAQSIAYDVRTGAAETVMKAFVAANMGLQAPAPRRISALAVEPSQGRGPNVKSSARFDVIGELLASIASVSGLGFHVVQVGDLLEFRVFEPRDRTSFVRLDLMNGTLSSHNSQSSPPPVTRAIVAGQGQGGERTLLERTNPAAVLAEQEWGPWGRIEDFIDQRQTNDPLELQQAGDERLTEGAAVVSVKAVPSDDQTMRYPQDWNVGDVVAIVLEGQEVTADVTSVMVQANRSGVRVGAGIGDVTGWDPTNGLATKVSSQDRRLGNLERNVEVTGAVGVVPGMIAMFAMAAPAGWLLCDGRAVSRSTYSRLFATIGTSFGAGNGTDTFALPDLRGRTIIGPDPADATMNALGKTGGAKTHTLTTAEMPSHNHTQDPHNHTQNSHNHTQNSHSHAQVVTAPAVGGPGLRTDYTQDAASNAFVQGVNTAGATATNNATTATNNATTATNNATGGGGAHNNMPPFLVLNHYIAT